MTDHDNNHANAVAAQLRLAEENGTLPADLDVDDVDVDDVGEDDEEADEDQVQLGGSD